jgi:hypothetical protein
VTVEFLALGSSRVGTPHCVPAALSTARDPVRQLFGLFCATAV